MENWSESPKNEGNKQIALRDTPILSPNLGAKPDPQALWSNEKMSFPHHFHTLLIQPTEPENLAWLVELGCRVAAV